MPAGSACLISIKVVAFGLGIHLGMKAKDFVVGKRPTLAKITKHPTIEFANYERRLKSMQSGLSIPRLQRWRSNYSTLHKSRCQCSLLAQADIPTRSIN